MKFFKWQIITITTILSLYALYNIHLIERISIRQYFDLMFSVEKSISFNMLRPKSEQTVAFANDKKAYGFEGHEDEMNTANPSQATRSVILPSFEWHQ